MVVPPLLGPTPPLPEVVPPLVAALPPVNDGLPPEPGAPPSSVPAPPTGAVSAAPTPSPPVARGDPPVAAEWPAESLLQAIAQGARKETTATREHNRVITEGTPTRKDDSAYSEWVVARTSSNHASGVAVFCNAIHDHPDRSWGALVSGRSIQQSRRTTQVRGKTVRARLATIGRSRCCPPFPSRSPSLTTSTPQP